MMKFAAFNLIAALNKDDLKEFSRFLKSPFHNTNKLLPRLFEYLVKYHPDFNDKKLTKEKVYGKIYPGRQFNEQALRSRMAELAQTARNFISIRALMKDSHLMNIKLVSELTERKKFRQSEKFIEEGLQFLDSKEFYEDNYFKQKYELLQARKNILYERFRFVEGVTEAYRSSEFFLGNLLVELLKLGYDIKEMTYIFKPSHGTDHVQLFFSRVDISGYLEEIKNSNPKNYSILLTYYYSYLMFQDNKNENNYRRFKELVYEHHRIFTLAEMHHFWTGLVSVIDQGLKFIDRNYIKEGHEINKFFLKIGALNVLHGSYFDEAVFRTTFSIAVRSEDWAWAEKFIDDYRELIDPPSKDNVYNYLKGQCLFNRGDNNGSVKCFSKTNFTDIVMNIDVRFYYIMNYYEMGLFEEAASAITAFRQFIASNPGYPAHLIENNKASLRFMSKMVDCKFYEKELDYADFKEAENTERFMAKPWILNKMKQMI